MKHFLWALVEDVGLDVVQEQDQRRTLNGLGLSPFYGCYLRRPIDVIQRPERKLYLEQVTEALGGTNVDISRQGQVLRLPLAHRQRRERLRDDREAPRRGGQQGR